VAKRGKRRKEESPRWDEIRLLNRVTGEVLRQLLERTRTRAGGSLGTASWLAGGLSVSESTLSRMLSGSHSPAFENIWFAAETLGVRPSQLVAVIEDAMERVTGFELQASDLFARMQTGELDDDEVDALLRERLAGAVDDAALPQEPWELEPGSEVEGSPASVRRWTSMFDQRFLAPIATAVLGAAAGVAASRFFGRDDEER
jgi:transcriptional regulator with XRE-family HTH domain